MALFSGVVRSTALAMDTGLTVILPWDRPADEQAHPCPVLYLLHGLGDNHAAWARYTGIERYARKQGLAVIMPEVQRSFYCDMAHGPDYFTYITEELPTLCHKLFHLPPAADRCIAGLSMGGYGALKCAFTHPSRYRGCASFSGVLDIEAAFAEHTSEKMTREFQAVLGTDMVIADSDNLFALSAQVAGRPQQELPDIFITCGTEDFLHNYNVRFAAHLKSLPLAHTYREWSGEHTWDFWDASVQMALERWF